MIGDDEIANKAFMNRQFQGMRIKEKTFFMNTLRTIEKKREREKKKRMMMMSTQKAAASAA